MDDCRLGRGVFHAIGIVADESEVRILIDGHGDQAGDLGYGLRPLRLVVTPDLWVGCRKGGHAVMSAGVLPCRKDLPLHGWEHYLTNIRAVQH